MKNFPFFTTQSGVASLVLEQVPFNKTAYIRIQSCSDFRELLKECLDFCKAVGAETVFAAGDDRLITRGEPASVIRMERRREGLAQCTAQLVTTNRENAETFRQIYNRTMCRIPNAALLTNNDLLSRIDAGECYFVYQEDLLLGVGIASGSWIHTVISLVKGAGEMVLLALNRVLEGESIQVELIDCNIPAKRLYERLGFTVSETISTWYKIL